MNERIIDELKDWDPLFETCDSLSLAMTIEKFLELDPVDCDYLYWFARLGAECNAKFIFYQPLQRIFSRRQDKRFNRLMRRQRNRRANKTRVRIKGLINEQ